MKKRMFTKLITAVICGTMITGTGTIVPFANENIANAADAQEMAIAETVSQVEAPEVIDMVLPEEKLLSTQAEEALYATVSFDLNGMSGQNIELAVPVGSLMEKPKNPICAGYAFTGWFKEPECVTEWVFETDIITEDTTLYAGWAEEKPADDERSVEIDESALPDETAPEREGHEEAENVSERGTDAISEDTGPDFEAVAEEQEVPTKEGDEMTFRAASVTEEEKQNEEQTEEAADAENEETLLTAAEKIPTVKYRTHVQSIGWQGYVKDGAMAGTTGQSKRLEGINISLENMPVSGGIEYRTHVQSIGWQGYVKNGEMAGTSGQSKRLEAIQIRLTGEIANRYDVWYQTHVQHFGWSGWAKNNEMCGSAGYAYRLEGIRIRLVKKNGSAPGSTVGIFHEKNNAATNGAGYYKGTLIKYNTHVQTYGWQDYAVDGQMAGTSGQSKRLEGIHIELTDIPYSGGVEYRTHVQSIGWQGWKANGAMSGTSGRSLRLEAIQIRLTGVVGEYYDVYYKVHAQTYGWLDWAKNGEVAGTAGLSKRLEGINIKLVKKGTPAPGNTGRPFVADAVNSQTAKALNAEAQRNTAAATQTAPSGNTPQTTPPGSSGSTATNPTASGNTSQQTCKHTKLKPVYKTVTRTEEETVVDKEGYWTQKCHDCGFEGTGIEMGTHRQIHEALYQQYKRNHDGSDNGFENYFLKNKEKIWEYARQIAKREDHGFNLSFKEIEEYMAQNDMQDADNNVYDDAENYKNHTNYTFYHDPETHTAVKTYRDTVIDHYDCADCGKTYVKSGDNKVIKTELVSTMNK